VTNQAPLQLMPMTCDDIRQLLLSLELDEESRRQVFEALAHLESCEPCRTALRDFDKLAALLHTGKHLDESLPPVVGAEADETPSAADLSPMLPDRSGVSPTGGWEAFESKLLAAARGGRQRPLLMRINRWLPALGGLAAIVLVGWGAFNLGMKASALGSGAPVAKVPSVGPPKATLVRLSPDDVAEKVRTFDAIDHSFDGQTRWLMLSGPNNTDVGLINQCPESPATRRAGDKILLVRLNLVRGGDVVSQADVLLVPGTTANFVVPTKLGVPLQYHIVTSALDPMRLRVQVQVPGGAVSVAAARQVASAPATAVLGTSLELEPYRDASAGRFVVDRQAFDLQVAAAASSLPG
jgi:hypothetical protein